MYSPHWPYHSFFRPDHKLRGSDHRNECSRQDTLASWEIAQLIIGLSRSRTKAYLAPTASSVGTGCFPVTGEISSPFTTRPMCSNLSGWRDVDDWKCSFYWQGSSSLENKTYLNTVDHDVTTSRGDNTRDEELSEYNTIVYWSSRVKLFSKSIVPPESVHGKCSKMNANGDE